MSKNEYFDGQPYEVIEAGDVNSSGGTNSKREASHTHTLAQETEFKPKRIANFELVRIVAMFMIVFHHFFVHTDVISSISGVVLSGRINHFWQIEAWDGEVGVALFILISGYFLPNFKWKNTKLLKIWQPAVFYSVLLVIAFICITYFVHGEAHNKLGSIFKSFFPIILFPRWWFVTAFTIMLVVSPVFRSLLEKMTPRLRIVLFGIMLVFLVAISFFPITLFDGTISTVINFGTIMLGGWILHDHKEQLSKHVLFVRIVSGAIIFIYYSANYFVADHFGVQSSIQMTYFYNITSPIVITTAMAIFSIIMTFNIKNARLNKTIFLLGPLTFGVYLIHEGLPPWNYFPTSHFAQSPFLIIYAIVIALAVFIGCAFIEFGRQKLFKTIGTKINTIKSV